MNGQHPRQTGASRGIILCRAGLVCGFGLAGWAALADTSQVATEAGLRAELSSGAAPSVAVRVGDHGDFERVVFEWPEAIDYDLVQRAEEVIVSFSRPGRIDLDPLRNGFGDRLVGAWTGGGEESRRVVLQLSPDAGVHSFSLKDDHIVVIDVSGGTALQRLAQPAPDREEDAIRELKRALEQRDALIADLLARVERLERGVALSSGDLDRVVGGRVGTIPPTGGTPPPQARSQPEPAAPASEPASDPAAAPSESAGSQRRETAQVEAPAPGQVVVDEEAVERALDFTLVQEGALLLPVGRAEITPRFTYTRRAGDFPVVVDPGGASLLGEREVRRNEFDFFAGLQVGLPFDSQLELGLPYNLVDQSIVDRVGGSGREESSDTGHGLGDFSVGLAKTVLREDGWWPDVILRVNWDTGTGERVDNDVGLDGGFQDIRGSVSLAKRQDPLVFVGGGFYETVFEENDVDPGDRFGFNVGTFLAASPNTSLSLVLNQSFIDEFEVGGQRIDGSDRVESILSFGAGTVLGRNLLLSGAVGVGLTDDSPDYSVSISLPVRFSIPGL